MASDSSSDNDNKEGIPIVEKIPIFRTTIRQTIAQYLPPPVVTAISQIDPQLEPYIGPEPSVTIFGSFCLALLVWQWLMRAPGRKGTAIQDDDDQEDTIIKQKNQRYFDSTILFCGPSLAGKTSLFYNIVYPQRKLSMGTVKSISSNTGYVENNHDSKVWRYFDVPGHWGASKLESVVLDKEIIDRIVLVLDSTQPVSKAADYLYTLVQRKQQKDLSIPVLIACHKAKAPKAKNFRRIKLNLRNELERYEKLSNSPTNIQNWDDVLDSYVFCSSSIDPPLLEEIQSFCQTGSCSNQ
jgi:signal recognition particle receptor subunit beta